VVTLQDPRRTCGLGSRRTAKITTATRSNVLSIPIQALTMPTQDQLDHRNPVQVCPGRIAAAKESLHQIRRRLRLARVFVIRNKKAEFIQVSTGITGTTDIEVIDGLKGRR